MKSKTILAVLVILLGLISFTVQAVPSAISYQGYLTGPSGTPIDGNVDITFSLYDADSAGSLSWQETQISVAVSKGLFKVELGSISPFATGQFDIPMWLGIKVGVDAEMSPRLPLSSVGYALKAEDAETLGGLNSVELNQSAHVTDTTNPHNVTAVQAGAASITELGSHTSNSANPHNVTVAQTGAASASAFSTHSTDAAAHHARYQNSEAVSAMAVKADSNPLHHDKYSDSAAVLAIKANDGSGSTLDADLIDGMQANEIIDAASDEVRTPISSLPFSINTSGSYYVTQNLNGSAGGIDVTVDNVTIDLMGFKLDGGGLGINDYGINLSSSSNIVVRNGTVRGFGLAGVYNNYNTSRGNIITDIQLIGNGTLGTSTAYSGIYLLSRNNRVERCVAKDSGGDGINVGAYSIIKDSSAESSGGSGIRAGSSSIIERNRTIENTGYGIFTNGGASVVSNNVSSNNGFYGIYAGGNSVVLNNTSYSNDSIGILTGTGCTLINNTASYNQDVGIFAGSSCKVIGNSTYINNLSNNTSYGGIKIRSNSLVENNVADANREYGIYIDGTNNVLRKNHVTNTTDGIGRGFYFVSSDNVLIDNTATGNNDNFAGSVPPASRYKENIEWN